MTTKTHEIKLDGYGAHTTLAEDRPIMLLGTAESYGIETLHVVSGKSWEGLTVTATFNAPDGTSTDMLMDAGGNITVPSEATAKSGSGRIVFTGVSNGIQRISCDLDYFVVAHSAINGVQSGGTAPSWFEQAVTRFMPAGGTAGQVLTKVTDTDFEAEWQDSQGGADGKSAYSYAVDGGYTGTEAEFAAKLAAESIDKALFVVNITTTDGRTFSADKTFEEITQAYNEGKYNIVVDAGGSRMPFLAIRESTGLEAIFGRAINNGVDSIIITDNNEIKFSHLTLATTKSKLPNPYPLTFTGAVSETYDGSSAKTIEIPSGGGGAHSDWNQNDSTAADYIKNRPFYMGDPVETVLVEERTVPFVGQGGIYGAEFQSTFVPTVGETYKVSWDGTVYECTCVDFHGSLLAIGNLSIAGAGSDTGEPFVMLINGAGTQIVTLDTSASHTFSISRFTQEVVKIDEKYLPDVLTTKMNNTNPTGSGSFSLNRKADTPIGENSFAEGWKTTASGERSHAEGSETTASGRRSHAEGNVTTASGKYSHAEGYATIASGEGSHAEGYSTIASSNRQHVQGQYNIEDSSNTYANIVGNGSPDSRSNAHTLDWEGNAWYSGTVEGKALILPSSTTGSTKKFKITVDDSGTITATEIGAAS